MYIKNQDQEAGVKIEDFFFDRISPFWGGGREKIRKKKGLVLKIQY